MSRVHSLAIDGFLFAWPAAWTTSLRLRFEARADVAPEIQ